MSDKSEIVLVGFGEAGQALARGWALPTGRLCAYDVKLHFPDQASSIRDAAQAYDVHLADTVETALTSARTIFCLVPTDQTVAAAKSAAPFIHPGTIWLDGSSSSPGRKRRAAATIDAAGGRYVDMAIMAPVYPRLHRTPVLLSGAAAEIAQRELASLGMVAELAGPDVGGASAIKMIRSVLIKGMEAITAECLLAARRAGVEDAILHSLASSDPDVDWKGRTAYNLERMTRHGNRRAAELREAVATLDELGVPSRMSAATAIWQNQVGDMGIAISDEPLFARLDAVLTALE